MELQPGQLVPANFDEANVTMVAEGCRDLPVFKSEGLVISCWQLRDDQIEMIKTSKRIYLGIVGNGQPPVWLDVDNPFTPREEWPEDITPK